MISFSTVGLRQWRLILNSSVKIKHTRGISKKRAREEAAKFDVTEKGDSLPARVKSSAEAINLMTSGQYHFDTMDDARYQKSTVSFLGDDEEDKEALYIRDIVLIGCGEAKDVLETRERIAPFFKKHKLKFEVLPTNQACTTFNYLSSENRYAAAVLFPPKVYQYRTQQDQIFIRSIEDHKSLEQGFKSVVEMGRETIDQAKVVLEKGRAALIPKKDKSEQWEELAQEYENNKTKIDFWKRDAFALPPGGKKNDKDT